MGDHVKMMDLLSKLGTEGFAAIIREHDGKNNGPLHYAALNNDVLMTKLLIQYGAGIYISCDLPIDFFLGGSNCYNYDSNLSVSERRERGKGDHEEHMD